MWRSSLAQPADIMVIMAHPDDAEFGAGGTVASWTGSGKQVVYVVCTSGEKGTTDINMRPEILASIREKEQERAAQVLGVREVIFLRYPDQGVEDTPEFRKQIVRQVRAFRPHSVVTSDPYRRYVWHRDHRILGQVVLDAVFPYARDHLAYSDLLEEGLKPHKVRELLFWASEITNCKFDVTQTFTKKITALRCHESQMAEIKKPDIEQWLRERCREMANGESYELAEAFYRVELPE